MALLYEPNKSTIPKKEQTLAQSKQLKYRKASMESTRKRKDFFLSKFNLKL